MCDPTTTAQFGLALNAGSTVVGATAAYDKARIERAVASNNADLATWQARDALERGGKAELRRRAGKLKGSQVARLAAGNVQLQGSALDVLENTDRMTDADAEVIRRNAGGEAGARSLEAAGYRARAAGNNPGIAASTTLLAGAGQVADRWYSYQERYG